MGLPCDKEPVVRLGLEGKVIAAGSLSSLAIAMGWSGAISFAKLFG